MLTARTKNVIDSALAYAARSVRADIARAPNLGDPDGAGTAELANIRDAALELDVLPAVNRNLRMYGSPTL